MTTKKVTVPWPEGLHLRAAVRVVRVARRFRAKILLRTGARVADAGSTLGLLVLCATLNAPLEIEAAGDDEQEAVQAIACCFGLHESPQAATILAVPDAGPNQSDRIGKSA